MLAILSQGLLNRFREEFRAADAPLLGQRRRTMKQSLFDAEGNTLESLAGLWPPSFGLRAVPLFPF
jgi:hypothetical protein